MGWEATVVAFNLHNWTDLLEQSINDELSGVRFYYLDHSKKDIPAVFFEKAGRLVTDFLFNSVFFSGMGVSRRSRILLRWCRKASIKADLIIAHNPAAFYPAYSLAKKKNIPFAVDIEDYHPGEGTDASSKKANEILMKKLLPLTAYTSFAAPLIMQYSQRLFKSTGMCNLLVNNLFSAAEFIHPPGCDLTSPLKLVWFSQFIDYGRGIEKLLPVLDAFSENTELTLIGDTRKSFFENEIQSRSYITVLKSMPQPALNRQLSKYDIGLAFEDPEADLNRDICLTNKLWAYFQAGLYILGSGTKAQSQFLQTHPSHGSITALDHQSIVESLKRLILTKRQIKNDHATRFHGAAQYNWENESLLLKNKWIELLQ